MTRFSLEEPCTYATQNYCMQRKMEREEDDGGDRAAAGGAFVITVWAKPEGEKIRLQTKGEKGRVAHLHPRAILYL